MHRVVEVADVDEPHGHTDERDDLGELLSKLVQLLLQWRLLLLSGCHLVTDLSDLCGDTCGHSYTNGFSCRDVGALNRMDKNG